VQRALVWSLASVLAVGAPASGALPSRPTSAAIPHSSTVAPSLTPRSTAPDAQWAGPPRDVVTTPRSPIRPSPSVASQASALARDGIPVTALTAYQNASRRQHGIDPTCGLSWPLLAGIGRVESDHGRFAGAVLHTDGVSTPRIIGIPLDGNGTARILDTDHGRVDGDQTYDRAVGPMQFIPSTWVGYGVDGNGDHVADPFNVFDATAAAARYLCVAGGNLTTLAGQTRAVRAYNDSDAYIAMVLQLEGIYARGVPGLTVPVLPPGTSLPTQRSAVPPANPGPPLGTAGAPASATSSPTPVASASGTRSPSPTAVPPSTSAPPTPSITPCPTTPPSDPASTSPVDTATPTPTAGTTAASPTPTSPDTGSATTPPTPLPPSATC
jgi:membrane-bound lytic murein transglycosylase B